MAFTRYSEDRIINTVREWERVPKDLIGYRLPANTPSALPLVAIAEDDIEHDDFGDVNWTTGSGFDQTLTDDNARQFSAYNPLLRVWAGARVLVQPCLLANSGANQWNIIHAWSATRLRCTAPVGGIAAGGSGVCTSPTDTNGTFGDGSLTVYSWTSSVAIQGSEELLAELYWDNTNEESRWRVYSADCT